MGTKRVRLTQEEVVRRIKETLGGRTDREGKKYT